MSSTLPATAAPAINNGSNRKNRALLSAAAYAAFTDLVHIFGGGITIARPLTDSSLPDEVRLVLIAVWHMTSAAMVLSAIALFVAALPRYAAANRNLAIFVSIMWIAFGLCFIGVAIFEGGNLITTLNQPILLIPVGVLGLWGCSRTKANQT